MTTTAFVSQLSPAERQARQDVARATGQRLWWDACEACDHTFLNELDATPLCDRCRSTREAARARLAGRAQR